VLNLWSSLLPGLDPFLVGLSRFAGFLAIGVAGILTVMRCLGG
jgi:hypothetical protein